MDQREAAPAQGIMGKVAWCEEILQEENRSLFGHTAGLECFMQLSRTRVSSPGLLDTGDDDTDESHEICWTQGMVIRMRTIKFVGHSG